MRCPHCGNEIPGKECPECGASIPEESRFCMACGARLEKEAETTGTEEDGFDLENRILCPDGTCTGIIVDGRCTECGKPYPESEPQKT
ncbi:MAG: zinc-ribbon domain-containing protein [Deltaproteobacteria bacterium]|nr:zinc-ribbon domain-containing protein [Deltaproteobacteria bacterium]MBW1935098.1 zinc-ribbon domain-containing protein [Deltaproteobacteria bacterium]MBW1977642.1 zinc-ribbon domain-containing protein [Deltaproteobacteria bacterium]MBW2044984.1 zinc-ribbon domain-containing protein [Deltaproteobacteria bacterium]MBW2299787.1 zinc-ribbon domain-containing protein [Deltaproteobacteria bacterium]